MTQLPPIARVRKPFLSLGLALPWIVLVTALIVPLAGWFDLCNATDWKNVPIPWGHPGIYFLVYLCGILMFCLPIVWITRLRAVDFLCLWMGQEALGIFGYCFLDTTSGSMPQDQIALLGISWLLVAINSTGFAMFVIGLGLGWGMTKAFGFPLAPLPAPAEDLDRRLGVLARFMGVFVLIAIAVPMVLSHDIPLISSRGVEERLAYANVSDTGRALYNLSTALLPVVIGCLTVAIVRSPRRIFGWDGLLLGLLPVAQLLTSNRAPILFSMAITLCLLSLVFRWKPIWLVLAFVSYLFAIVFLSGFTSILRSNPRSLLTPDWFKLSVKESYMGDNIIDYRDGSWVFCNWDFQPFMGKTYLSGLESWAPSGLLPQKKEWNIGLVGVRMVGMSDQEHFGLRITAYGESFLNFGWVGVFCMGGLVGTLYGIMRRQIQLGDMQRRCLWWAVLTTSTIECLTLLTNTGDAFTVWSLLGLLALIWITVTYPAKRAAQVRAQGGR